MSEPAENLDPQNTGGQAQSWRDALPEDLRDSPTIKDINSVEDLTKSFISTQKMIGNSVRIPSEDASPEDRLSFYEKLDANGIGVVPKDEGEAFTALRNKTLGVTDDIDISPFATEDFDDSAALDELKEFAKETGMPAKFVQELYSRRADELKTNLEAQAAAMEEAGNALHKEFGEGLAQAIELGTSALQEFNDDGINAMLEETGLNNNPTMLKLLAKVGAALAEPSSGFGRQTPNVGMSPDDAADQIADVMANKAHAYHDRNHPDHVKAVEKMARLFRIKAG